MKFIFNAAELVPLTTTLCVLCVVRSFLVYVACNCVYITYVFVGVLLMLKNYSEISWLHSAKPILLS